jgi:hypothetical protein
LRPLIQRSHPSGVLRPLLMRTAATRINARERVGLSALPLADGPLR